MRDAKEKAEKKEKERLEKTFEKVAKKAIGTGKSKKKSSNEAKHDAKAPVASSSIEDVGSQLQSTSKRGTKRDSSYHQLSQVFVIDNMEDDIDCTIGEFIINTSLAQVLDGYSVPLPQVNEDLKAFMTSVGAHIYSIFCTSLVGTVNSFFNSIH